MSEHISIKRDGAVMRLGFNRPEKKNAITAHMYAALADALEEAAADEAVRAILFEAAGDMFTAGNDIGEFMAGGPDLSAPDLSADETRSVIQFLTAIATAQKPLLAAVQGGAVGVGVTMLLHCDLVYASDEATFHTPFTDLGVVPEAASSLLMPLAAGHQRAAEMLLAGKKIDAARACEFGFVNEVVRGAALEQTAMAAARGLAAKAPAAVRLTKQLMKGDREDILARMNEESVHFAERLKSAEFREAGMAFLQKRKPDFSK